MTVLTSQSKVVTLPASETPAERVRLDDVTKTCGQTGMAGGDHIRFAVQLDGVQIDPKEWWDAHWIKDHIEKRVDLPGCNSQMQAVNRDPAASSKN